MAEQFDPTSSRAPTNAPGATPSGGWPPGVRPVTSPGSTAAPASSTGAGSTTEVAKDEARSIKDRTAEAASSVGRGAGHEVAGLKDEAMSDARDLAQDAKKRVGAEADRAASEAAHALDDAARELTTMADRADHPAGPAAEVVRRAGEHAQTVAQRLEERGSQGVVDDITRFARNRPGVFLLGAGALGFVVGRVVRNTDTRSIVQATTSELRGSDEDYGPPLGAGSSGSIGDQQEIDLRPDRALGPELQTGLVPGQGAPVPASGLPGEVGTVRP